MLVTFGIRIVGAVLAVALIPAGVGCRTSDDPAPSSARTQPVATKGGRIATPDAAPAATNAPPVAAPGILPASGRIHALNPGLRFVVIDYTLGGLPPLQSLLHVYRGTERVGQVRLSGPERNGFAAADIVEGILQVGDEVREH